MMVEAQEKTSRGLPHLAPAVVAVLPGEYLIDTHSQPNNNSSKEERSHLQGSSQVAAAPVE